MTSAQSGPRDAPDLMAPILRRLSAWGELSGVETVLVEALAPSAVARPPRTVLAAENTDPAASMMASGWACRQRLLSDGRRQVVSFVLPGDALFPLMRPPLPVPCAAVALTPVVTVDATGLLAHARNPASDMPGLAVAVSRLDQFDEFLVRDQIVRLGRQVAYERMIHLMLELFQRLAAVGLTSDGSFPLPLTQEVLADTLGLSVVHVNRVLQQIRRDKLLDMRGGIVTILNLDQMRSLSDWVPLPAG